MTATILSRTSNFMAKLCHGYRETETHPSHQKPASVQQQPVVRQSDLSERVKHDVNYNKRNCSTA